MKNTDSLDEGNINDVLLDSCDGEYTGILAILTSKNKKEEINLVTAIIVLHQHEKYHTILLVSGLITGKQ